ncbi:MAG: fasciclin domain-containing protein [Armatimonas sp.]
MSLLRKQRFVRLTAALGVAVLIGSQIPMQGGVALARDGYPNSSGRFLGTSITTEQVFTAGILGVLGAAVLREKKAGGATSPAAGNGNLPVAGDSNKPIYEVLDSMPNQYSAVKGLVDGCDDVASALKDSGPFTFFSPSNPEVAKISSEEVSALRGDKTKLCAFLQKHTVLGRYKYQDLLTAGEKKLLTLSGATVTLTQRDGKAYIEGIEVTRSDIAASNGWVHDLKGVIR